MYPAYWTLSHRWGDQKNILQLLKTTENRFREAISLDDLCPTFRDAALLVHRLGHQYLWIDSLCILQDSLTGWQKEANAMVDVYRHSYCNVSAVGPSSNPSRNGLFRERVVNARLLYPFKTNVKVRGSHYDQAVDGPWMVWNDSAWTDEIEKSPLSTRGWVVQERFLASRVVHFTQSQVYWECLQSIHCGVDPSGSLLIIGTEDRESTRTTGYKSSRLELARTRANLDAAGMPYSNPIGMGSFDSYHRYWGTVVAIYVACDLTKESDRFVAMAGIAKTFSEISGDVYLAGLWKRMIYIDLLWATSASLGVQARRSNSYAPSWSWVSIVGGQVQLNIPRGKSSNFPTPLIKLTDARVVPEPPDGDPFGLLRSAELDIECMLYYYRWNGRLKKLSVYTDDARTQCYFEKENDAGILQLDTSDLVKRFAEAGEIEGVCVPVCGAYGSYGGGNNKYLVLEHDTDTRFRRIGVISAGEIGKWISSWSGHGSHITLI
ncbi:Fc.00g001510.m01.CDS01 [Cosmosporella sp. VM-42]